MQTQDAYNNWAKNYDTVVNPTRDLEAKAIRISLEHETPDHLVEIGCGTGKNTQWLVNKCIQLTAVDFSPEMLKIANEKITDERVQFKQADITKQWTFDRANFITCSLVFRTYTGLIFHFSASGCYTLHWRKILYSRITSIQTITGKQGKI